MHAKSLGYVNNNETFIKLLYLMEEVNYVKKLFHFSVTKTAVIVQYFGFCFVLFVFYNNLVINLLGEHGNSIRKHFICLKRH